MFSERDFFSPNETGSLTEAGSDKCGPNFGAFCDDSFEFFTKPETPLQAYFRDMEEAAKLVESPNQTQPTLTQNSVELSVPADIVSSQVSVKSTDVPFSQMTDIEAEFETSFVDLSLQDQAGEQRKDESVDFTEMAPEKDLPESVNLDPDATIRLSDGEDAA